MRARWQGECRRGSRSRSTFPAFLCKLCCSCTILVHGNRLEAQCRAVLEFTGHALQPAKIIQRAICLWKGMNNANRFLGCSSVWWCGLFAQFGDVNRLSCLCNGNTPTASRKSLRIRTAYATSAYNVDYALSDMLVSTVGSVGMERSLDKRTGTAMRSSFVSVPIAGLK